MEFFVENAGIIAFLPLWVFLIIVFAQNLFIFENKKFTLWLTAASTFIGLVCSAFILAWTINHPEAYVQNFNWLEAGNIKLSLGVIVDRLSAMMLVVVTSVSLLIQIYSHEYMDNDDGYHRFFAYLNLFNFSMLGLVLSSNLFQTYIFWELVGVSSYLLIGFWFRRPSAAGAATKAFLMNRIGDFGLLLGILLFVFYSLGWWNNSGDVLLSFTSMPEAVKQVHGLAGASLYAVIAILIFMGPVAKSAQFPLHTWLPDAMEGPTPISALIHAATMVAAGVYLIARVYPVFEISPLAMNVIMYTGATTALMAATIAITQQDIKKALAYSTCSQLGFMVMAMGAGAYAAGLFHLMTHAYFKAMLFLCSGAVIHGLSDQQDMRYMGGLRKHMPAVAYTYLIGCLAISGIFLSGFWSKEEIFSGLYEHNQFLLLILAMIIAGMTAFYMFRTYFLTFEGEYRGNAHPHNAGKVLTLPLIILAVPSAIIGFVLCGKFGFPSFDAFIRPVEEVAHHSENLMIPILSLLVSLAGVGLAALLYTDKLRNAAKINLDSFISKIKPVYNFSTNLWYIDRTYSNFVKLVVVPVSEFLSAFDKFVVDGIVNFVGLFARFNGWILRLFQTGNVQTYATIMFCGLMLITFVVSIYWLIY
jgi:NAD(P)H-quinone oxidoreductase subunit 5